MIDSKTLISTVDNSILNKYARIEDHLVGMGYEESMVNEVHMTVNHDSNVEIYWLDMSAGSVCIIATCEHIYTNGACNIKLTMTNQIKEREVINRLSCSRN